MAEKNRLKAWELALRWEVPTTTLSQWRWQGVGPQFVKLGKHVVYRLQDVEAFEEQNLRQNTCNVQHLETLNGYNKKRGEESMK